MHAGVGSVLAVHVVAVQVVDVVAVHNSVVTTAGAVCM
jgi:hypothetical protein